MMSGTDEISPGKSSPRRDTTVNENIQLTESPENITIDENVKRKRKANKKNKVALIKDPNAAESNDAPIVPYLETQTETPIARSIVKTEDFPENNTTDKQFELNDLGKPNTSRNRKVHPITNPSQSVDVKTSDLDVQNEKPKGILKTNEQLAYITADDESKKERKTRLHKVRDISKKEKEYRRRSQDRHSPESAQQDDNSEQREHRTVKFSHDPVNPLVDWPEDPAEVSLCSCASCFERIKGLLKVIFAIFIFIMVSGSLIVSKGSLLYISSQMNPFVGFQRYGNRETMTQEPMRYSQPGYQCGALECKTKDNESCVEKESVRWIWAMFMCQCVPYSLVICRSAWKMCFKRKEWPSIGTFLWVAMVETIHTTGICILLYHILPSLDIYRSLLLMCGVAFLPSVLMICNKKNRTCEKVCDVIASCLQFTAMIGLLYPEVTFSDSKPEVNVSSVCNNFTDTMKSDLKMSSNVTDPPLASAPDRWILPYGQRLPETIQQTWPVILAMLFISIGYWENFVDKNTSGCLSTFLNKLKKKINKSHTKTYLFISIWKILLTLIFLVIYHSISSIYVPIQLDELFNTVYFYDNAASCGGYLNHDNSFHSDWIEVSFIQISMGVICFIASDMAIQTQLQVPSFTVPLVLCTPVCYLLLSWACTSCDDAWNFGTEYYWNCFSGHDDHQSLFTERWVYFGFFWWMSLLWITRYLWFPKIEKLAMLDKIFTYPFPCGALLEQSMMLIRRRNDEEVTKPKDDPERIRKRKQLLRDAKLDDCVPTMSVEKLGTPFIYACCTMWHESREEMLLMLQSIFRLNCDQRARYEETYTYKLVEPDYYEFEAHIFFDDAYTSHHKDCEDVMYTVNDFVKTFVGTVSQAASYVHNVDVIMTQPSKYNTPYGGRLEWALPLGNNKLIVHLKDKQKIRIKKRWSQVMYMNSLIGRGIIKQDVDEKVQKYVSKNTYILALDGDIDFQPEAVLHLLDMMRRDDKVAAACGRIHPTGSGPIVWYQKFEYSISHWLQKSTEHVFGCVLCSPGCFSLFRASALMDENIVSNYSKQAEQPHEYIQFDQGEDRWLCTLLVQQGHRIEYSAAADAFTNAPEDFNEFFNQRRRWITSTFANIIDLLLNARSTAKKNESISLIYMTYQAMLFVASILGPGTIFLLICGSFQVIWGVSPFISFAVAVVPLVLFVLLCFHTKPKTQLFYALILSGIFAIVQMIVLAGILRVVITEGICATSTIFLLYIVGIFVIAALMHPLEFTNLFHIFFFYLCIPCTYLLLIIYSICNVNQTSWGTREAQTISHSKKKKGFFAKYFNIEMIDMEDESEGYCMCWPCCNQKGVDERLNQIREALVKPADTSDNSANHTSVEMSQLSSTTLAATIQEQPGPWINDANIGQGPIAEISSNEKMFWEKLITDVLSPEEGTTNKEKVQDGLNQLRNKAVCWFIMIDLLLMVFVLSLNMSLGNYGEGVVLKYNCTANPGFEYQLDPIGFTFIFVFGFLTFIQLVGMMIHRVFTFIQFMASVILCKSTKIQPSVETEERRSSYSFARQMQRLDITISDDEREDEDNVSVISYTDDNHHSRRVTKRRKSYLLKEMQNELDARNAALKQHLGEVDSQLVENRMSITAQRRPSVYQPVIDAMHRRRSSITTGRESEVSFRPDAVESQRKVVDKILRGEFTK